jgi:L-iditol 2-dehydrogenase
MKAAVLHATNQFVYEEIALPQLGENDVKVQVMAAGICGSDTHKMASEWKYPLPAIMGHEFSGIITEKGASVRNVEIGDRVAVIPFLPCYTCEHCQRGHFSLCDDHGMIGSKSFGGFAEYVNVPAMNVLKIGDIDFEEAAMIEPLAVSLHGVLNIEPRLGDTVAVFGAGSIGLLVIQCLKIAGAKVIAIDISNEKLAQAKEYGCDYTINSLEEDLVERIYAFTDRRGVDIAMECAGSKITQEQCLLITRKKGKIGYLGIAYQDVLLSQKAFENIFRKELTLTGFWNSYSAPFPGEEWTKSLELIQEGRVQLKKMVSHRFSLEETQQAFDIMLSRSETYGKVLIIPNGEGINK